MKATQVAVLYEPKKYNECIVCKQPTYAPYALVEDGKWVCRRSCLEDYTKGKEQESCDASS